MTRTRTKWRLVMLTKVELESIAWHARDQWFEAHRGAVWFVPGRTVIVFANDGSKHESVGHAAISMARGLLEADGFVIGPVVADPDDGYTVVFEAVPPAGTAPLEACDLCTAAAWEGWGAVRNLDPDRDGYAVYQRGIANSLVGGEFLSRVPRRPEQAGGLLT